MSRLQTAVAAWDGVDVQPAFPEGFRHWEAGARRGLDRTFVITVPEGSDTVAMAAAFAEIPGVENAEVDGIGGVAAFYPDDPTFSLQYGLHNVLGPPAVADADIDAPEAWAMYTGNGAPVTVAVIDSGVDPHPEFADRMVPGTNTSNPEFPDLTSDGCPHGTHVAGIITAEGNNGMGVAGVSWGAKIMPVRVVNGCTGTELQCANGILWAVDHGADICNVSLQYYTGTQALMNAVQYAQDRGVMIVAAAGNNQGNIVAFPARFANSFAVSATNNRDVLAVFSNWGSQVDVCAPGEDIWSTWVAGTYWMQDGTSMATPHVSGLAALLLSFRPHLSATELRELIIGGAEDRGNVGFDDRYGHGRINAFNSLLAAEATTGIIGSYPPSGAIDAGQPFDLRRAGSQGWREVELTFDGDISALTPEGFLVATEGGVGSVPEILSVTENSVDTVLVTLSAPLDVGAWTVLTHIASGTSVRLGFLPGDVNGDGTTGPLDVLALIDSLNEVGQPLPEWSTDVNRSGETNPADVLRVIDLMNGADDYDPFLDMSLP